MLPLVSDPQGMRESPSKIGERLYYMDAVSIFLTTDRDRIAIVLSLTLHPCSKVCSPRFHGNSHIPRGSETRDNTPTPSYSIGDACQP